VFLEQQDHQEFKVKLDPLDLKVLLESLVILDLKVILDP
jgi:hypothetical protein